MSGHSADFTARPYQEELYEVCKTGNTIVCLDTGCGKTFIAVMLIRHLSPKCHSEGKRIFFVVPSIPLVSQQSEVIQNHTDLRVGKCSGSSYDDWTKEQWMEELNKYDVVVLIDEIFRRILHQGFVSLSQMSLLVVDECHHAIKNHPCREIFRKFDDCPPEERPRILGLSASPVSGGLERPENIHKYIRDLELTMRSVCLTPTDLGTINKFAAKPSEEVIQFDSFDVMVFDDIKLLTDFSESLLTLLGDVTLEKKTIKNLSKLIKDTLYTLTTMGVWCAKKVCRNYISDLSDTIEMLSFSKARYTGIVLKILKVIYVQLSELLRGLTPSQKLLQYSSPKLQELVKLLKSYNSNLCAIVFVERRSGARVLCRWLQELAKLETTQLSHLKADYVLGAGSSYLIGNSSKKQEQSLIKFRSHECNLLVATSVLEEGVDVPRCNLVVRYDWPKTYCQYIQSKGRARDQRGKYILFVERNQLNEKRKELEKFGKSEELLHKSCHQRTAPTETETEYSFNDEEVKPYVANQSESSGRVSLNSAIPILDRYCRKLPSDSFTKPSPHYTIEGRGPPEERRYVCILRLPINCQIRHQIRGKLMGSKIKAKKAAAFEACVELHKNKELDDHFLPVKKVDMDYIKELGLEPPAHEMEKVDKGPRPGTNKRRQYYNKLVADVFNRTQIEPNIKCFLYEFVMNLSKPIPEEQNTRGRKITDPAHTTKNFGFLTTQRVPTISEFPVFTRSGEVSVNLKLVREDILLTEEQIEDLSIFHNFTFSEVLGLIKYPLEFNPQKSNSKHFVVPIDCSEFGGKDIDWHFVKQIKRHTDSEAPNSGAPEIRKHFIFEANQYTDAVVIPWYRKDKPQYFYVEEICHNLSPKSPFPDDGYETFEEYYSKEYEIEIMNTSQPLLDVEHTPAPINLLKSRYDNRSGVSLPTNSVKAKKRKRENLPQKFMLVPELCYVHPFPASFWRKAVCLPCLLFRLNSLLVADQMRYKVANESGIGFTHLKPGMPWPSLDFGCKASQEEGITNKPQESVGEESGFGEVPEKIKYEDIDGEDSSDGSTDIDYSDDEEDNGFANRGTGTSVNESRGRIPDVLKYELSIGSQNPNEKTTERLAKEKNKETNLIEKTQNVNFNFGGSHVNTQTNEGKKVFYSQLLNRFTLLLADENYVFNQLSPEISDEETDDNFEEPNEAHSDKIYSNVELKGDLKGDDSVGFGELLAEHLANRKQSESKPFIENFDPLKSDLVREGPSPAVVLQALTMSNASDGMNLERLETVGDSFLKFSVTAFLYCVCPDIHEGKLSFLRSRQIRNMNLYILGKRIGVGQFMNATKFEPKDNWCPPCFAIPEGLEKALIESKPDNNSTVYDIGRIEDINHLNADQIRDKIKDLSNEDLNRENCKNLSQTPIPFTIPYNLRTQHLIPDKSIADSMEALIGAYLISSGPRAALLFMKWLGLKVMPTPEMPKIARPNNDDIDNPLWHWLPAPKSPLLPPYDLNGLYDVPLSQFEEQIGYVFREKAYLVQAFTHISFYENQVTDCYQRLEFLGDAVLDYLITRYLYEDPAAHSPGVLTDLRSALVNNKFFASLSVKYQFHKHFTKYFCLDLFRVIEAFVKKVEQNSDRTEDLNLLIGEGENENTEDIEVPKALGDIFESVAGAIFLDSGMSLDAVWKVYYKMMKPEIEYFSSHVPMSPIRELLEMEPQNTTFGKPELCGRKVCVSVKIVGFGEFYGIARNKRTAKFTAAKRALRALKSRKRQ